MNEEEAAARFITTVMTEAIDCMRDDRPHMAGILLYGAYREGMKMHGIPGDEIGVCWSMAGGEEDILKCGIENLSAMILKGQLRPSINFCSYFDGIPSKTIDDASELGENMIRSIDEYIRDWADDSDNPSIKIKRSQSVAFARMSMAAASYIGMWSQWLKPTEKSRKVNGEEPSESITETSPFELMSNRVAMGKFMECDKEMFRHAQNIKRLMLYGELEVPNEIKDLLDWLHRDNPPEEI
jgi:hypothetical protein